MRRATSPIPVSFVPVMVCGALSRKGDRAIVRHMRFVT